MIFAFCGNWCLHVRAVNQAWKDKRIRQLENSRQRGWRNSKVNALQSFCDIFSPSRLRSFRTSRNGFIILWPLTFEATVIINSLEHHNENRKGEPDVWRFCWLCIKRGFTSAWFQQGGGGDQRWHWQFTVALACHDAGGPGEVYMMTHAGRLLVIFCIAFPSWAFWTSAMTCGRKEKREVRDVVIYMRYIFYPASSLNEPMPHCDFKWRSRDLSFWLFGMHLLLTKSRR